MKTRCPNCDTRYNIDAATLLEADGVARCHRCGTVFDAVAEDAPTQQVHQLGAGHAAARLDEQSELSASKAETDSQSEPPAEKVDPDSLSALLTVTPDPDDRTGLPEEKPAPEDGAALPVSEAVADQSPEPPAPRPRPDRDALPFEVPDDLEPLQPSPDLALDVVDTLYEKRSRRGLFYGLLAALLATGLGLQLAWQYRADLLKQFPALQPLCERIGCHPGVVRAPDKFSILQRGIKPTANETGSLTLSARIRNDAENAQPLPDIQLSLLDNNGGVLVRRRLTPDDYLFPAPPKEKLVTPGEVVTITLDFEDPGLLATGFVIGFL